MGNPNLEFTTGKILLRDKNRFLELGHLSEVVQFFRMINKIFVPVETTRTPSFVYMPLVRTMPGRKSFTTTSLEPAASVAGLPEVL